MPPSVLTPPAPAPLSTPHYQLLSRNPDGTVTLGGGAGEVIAASLAPSDVTNQREQLDTYLGGYQPFGFGADMMAPIVPANKEKGDRRDLGAANAFTRVDTKVGRQGAINTIDVVSDLGDYHCKEYALASFLAWQTENDKQENWNVRASIGMMLKWKLAIDREFRIRDLLCNPSAWHADNVLDLTSVSAAKWDTGTTKKPRSDLHSVARAMLMPCTGIYMNPDVAFHLLEDPGVRDFLKMVFGDNAPGGNLAQGAAGGMMEVTSIMVPGLVGGGNVAINIIPAKAMDPATGVIEYIWPDDVLLLSDPGGQPSDGLRMASALTYRTRGRSGTGIVTNEYIPLGRGVNSGSMFEVGYSDDGLVTGPQAGAYIRGVLS